MKKMMLAALCLGVLSFTSCSEDNSVPEQQEVAVDHLLGKWNFTRMGQKIEIDGEVIFDNMENPSDALYEIRYTFNKDNTVNSYKHFPATEQNEEATYEGTYNYEKKGNELIIKEVVDKEFTIVSLDKNELRLQEIMEFDSDSGHFKVTTVLKFDRP